MQVRVELFGIARQRAGVGELLLEFHRRQATLEDVLRLLAEKVPALGKELVVQGRLQPSLAANLDGQRFVSDPATPLSDGQCLLILSADAGG